MSLSADSVKLKLANRSSDRSLAVVLDMLSNRNYTVMYTTTPDFSTGDLPAKANQYEMYNDDQPLHSDLKRDVRPAVIKTQRNITMVDGPLFERYQFLSPGRENAMPILQNRTDSALRSLHGSTCGLFTTIDPVRCNLGHSKSPSQLRGIR